MKFFNSFVFSLPLLIFTLFSPAAAAAPPSERVNVLEMKSVPPGHYLLQMQLDGRDELVNVEIKGLRARAGKSSTPKLNNLEGQFQPIGNGVFLISFAGDQHRATQFWVFRENGTATIKEIPDRGERQTATPVKNNSLDLPAKER